MKRSHISHQRNLWKQWPQDFQSCNTSKFIEAKVFTTWTCQRAVFAAGAVLDALDFTTCHAKQRGYREVPCCAKMQCTFQKKCRILQNKDERRWMKEKAAFQSESHLNSTGKTMSVWLQCKYSTNTVWTTVWTLMNLSIVHCCASLYKSDEHQTLEKNVSGVASCCYVLFRRLKPTCRTCWLVTNCLNVPGSPSAPSSSWLQ